MSQSENIIITGASGFIGKEIINRLETASFNCIPLTREALGKFISNPQNLGINDCSLVHCAGHAHIFTKKRLASHDEFVKVNTDLTLAVAEASFKIGIKKFIFLSSISVFGRFAGGVIDINQTAHPTDPYGESKYLAELKLSELFDNQKISQCIILRLPMVYGPGNKGNMLPLLETASKGIPLPLSSTKGKRSLMYVKNVSDAITRILRDKITDRPPVATYMLNDRNDLTSGKLYELIFDAYNENKTGIFFFPENLARLIGMIGSGLEVIFMRKLPLSKEVISRLFDEFRFSCDQFCQDYNWSPPFSPEEGIKETVEWHKRRVTDQRNPDDVESNH